MSEPTSLPAVPARSRMVLGILLGLGLVLRLWYWWQVHDTHLVTVPYLDCHDYDQWARALVAGDWGRGEPYWMGPLYPHLLALSYAVFGVGSLVLPVIQILATLGCVVLVYMLGRRWLASETGALLAAALWSFYGPPVFYAGFRLMATLVTVLLLLVALQAWRAGQHPRGRSWFVLGLLVGITATTRGNVLALLPMLPLFLLPGRGLDRRTMGRLTALLVVGAGLAVMPVTVRNLTVGGDLVLLTSNAGVNLLIGQQAQYGGRFGPLSEKPQFEFDPTGRALLQAELGRDLTPSQVSRELSHRAVERILREPGEMVKHYGRKAYRFWSGYELPQIFSWNYWRGEHMALRFFPVPFVLLGALGLVGVTVLNSAARRQWLALIGAWFLGLMPFFPTARYRVPITPLLAITTAALILALVGGVRRRQWRQVGVRAGAALLLIVALWPRWGAFDPADETWHNLLSVASRAADAGDRLAILQACAEAEVVRPGLAETPYRQGGYLEKVGDATGALNAYEEAVRRLPSNAFVLYRRARTLVGMGRHREALIGYADAAAADPDWSFPWHGMALSLKALGRKEEAVAAFEKAMELEPGRSRYRSNLASLLAEMGRLDEAEVILSQLTSDFPDYVPGWFNLALVQSRLGQKEEARLTLERVAALPHLSVLEREQVSRLRANLDGR